MSIEIAELDKMQADYQQAVDAWIAAIRHQQQLASGIHDETEIDAWEGAGFAEEDAREKANAARKAYESALRQKFFNF